jgi:molecular chaperone DnaK
MTDILMTGILMTDILIGIDFGTSNTIITYFDNNKINILQDGVFKTIPSKICFYNDKTYCGNYIPLNKTDIIHSFKLLENNTNLLIIFFNHLYWLITKNLNIKGEIKSVITVPSNFNDKQREIIKSCLESVNIKVIRIINEPSAAALSYGLNNILEEAKILVLDLGGGTTDITILEKNETFFEVLHSEGLNIGGNTFTQLICNELSCTWEIGQLIKEKLTYLDSYEFNNFSLTREKFEKISSLILSKIKKVLNNIIDNNRDITHVLLVGGTCRIPILQKIIKETLNKDLWIHPNLETVVSEGACLYCAILEKQYKLTEDIVFMDITSLSLGVELADGTYSIIIPKNTPLPVKRTHKYTIDSPGDKSVKIKIYQGERKIANKNFLIGEFIFDKISAGGVPIIDISFRVDLNSIITVTAIDRKSGIEKNIIIKDIPKINQEEIDNIVLTASKSFDIDQEELIRSQHIYLIKIHIENALINLQLNDLITDDFKNNILSDFKKIEINLNQMNNLQLIETYKMLQDNYNILGHLVVNDKKEEYNIENELKEDLKNELINKIKILLNKNPEWIEYLEPVLEELSYNTITLDYINDKLNLVAQLNEENNNDPKEQVNNLCLYLKNELNILDLESNQKEELVKLIDDTINLLYSNNENINWNNQLKLFNETCELIYIKKL